MRSSRKAPRMPLRAAYTLTPRARAASITPAAVALITEVTPPDCAYSRRPSLMRDARVMHFSWRGPPRQSDFGRADSDLAHARRPFRLTAPHADATLIVILMNPA